MSHELRTPLNAIIGYSEILQEDVADLGQDNVGRDLKKIEGAGRHLLGLINDILDLSKVEAGKMDVFLEDVEIVPLLEEVRALIVPLAEKNGNTLKLRPAKNLGSMRTDRTKLKQSLLNILSNGSKFTQNGRLTLVAERFKADRPMVRFAVSDTGIGMTEEQLGRLFQAFSPGRCVHDQEVRRHRPRPGDFPAVLPAPRRRHHGHQPARQRLDLHHHLAGAQRSAGAGQARGRSAHCRGCQQWRHCPHRRRRSRRPASS